MNTGTTAICAEARRALESHNVTVAIAMLEAELNGQADAALRNALAVSYFQNEQYELAAQHYAAALKFDLQNSDWRDMLAVAQANAMAAVHVFVPELHYFDREQLLAPPEKPTLPAPLPSPAYPGLSTRFRIALGNVVSAS